MAELDLESILHSHAPAASDDEDEEHFFHRRTVDEILLNHASSSSSSSSPSHTPPHSPSTVYRRQAQSDCSSVSSSSETLRLPHSQSLSCSELKPSGSIISRIKSDDFSYSPPFLAGVIRSNARPGAALAAAAAASRSFPTRKAAAIRRAVSSSATPHHADVASLVATEGVSAFEVTQAVTLDNCPPAQLQRTNLSDSSGDLVNDSSQAQKSSRGGSGIFAKGDNDNDGGLIVSRSDNSSQGSSTSPAGNSIHSPIRTEMCFDVAGYSVEPELLANEDMNVQAETASNVQGNLDDEVSPAVSERHQDNMMHELGDHEVLSEGGDNSSDDSFADILQEKVMQEEGGGITEKKVVPSLSPIEQAEELEKKQTFAGMHWEEGAAAQPMMLEGVRRESTPLGYFDVNAENVLTLNFSSEKFRQDHGSPQVLAVHLNYIAVGMSKGLVVIVPSRYTPHHADDMDSKMSMLSLPGERAHIPVTSLCFNHQGDLLFAGYGDGQ